MSQFGIDAAWAGGQATGTGVYTRSLVRHVLPHLQDDHAHLYFRRACRDENPLYAMPHDALTSHVVDGHRVWRSVARLGPALIRDRIDAFLSPVCFMPLQNACPRIMTVYDMNVFDLGRHWWRRRVWRQYLAMRIFTTLSLQRAAHVVTISEATRRQLVKRFPRVADRCSVVYPAIDVEALSRTGEVPAAIQSLFGPYFLYVGVMSPTKNLTRLIQAFARLPAAPTTPHLVLAGRDSGTHMRDHLQPLIQQLGVSARVHWLGFVSDAERNALYRGALALTFPSLLEGFGYPIVESMYSGTPVITSTASSCPEVAGEAALCVEATSIDAIAQAMQTVASDAALRQRLIAAGRHRAAAFAGDRMGQAIVERLRAVAASTGGRHGSDRAHA
ncbi:MAG: glycosyltransferase family 1 protein [Verrucomicrobia bacterium]|nr:glycosyltransferase family 1 protein [Verrucomicrobiota bacterium]